MFLLGFCAFAKKPIGKFFDKMNWYGKSVMVLGVDLTHTNHRRNSRDFKGLFINLSFGIRA